MSSENTKNPNVFQYDDYRRFLSDMYQFRKANNERFSYRVFARQAAFRSSSFLKHVIDGKRNLSSPMMRKFAQALDLSDPEKEYFRLLVHFNQSKTVTERQSFAADIMRLRMFKNLNPLLQDKFEYWSEWYNVAIRELVGIKGFCEDPTWIAEKLRPRITPAQAQAGLQTLERLGLVARGEDGRLHQVDRDVASGDEMINASLAHFHQEMIQRANDALNNYERKARQISAVTIAVSEDTEQKIRQMIHQFRKDLLAAAQERPDPSRVIQVNFQLFPLSEDVT